MSADTTVKVSQGRDGCFTAVDTETGDSAEGNTRAEALANLARRMGAVSERVDESSEDIDSIATLEETLTVIEQLAAADQASVDELSASSEFVARSRDVRKRFDEEDVTEEDVAGAIEWARSQ